MTRQELRNWDPDWGHVATLLERAEIEECKLIPAGSNYVFLVSLRDGEEGRGFAVYKPQRGEAPLWDFPNGTLYRRERAAYLLAVDLGWSFIPPTVVRNGPHGPGAVQLYIPNDSKATFFTLREDHETEMRQIALFDVVANNADRKGGHCLLGWDGRIWGIDHGLTFHETSKLRTVIWDFGGDTIAPEHRTDLEALAHRLDRRSTIHDALAALLNQAEIEALRNRVDRLLQRAVYPQPGMHRSVPWPPV